MPGALNRRWQRVLEALMLSVLLIGALALLCLLSQQAVAGTLGARAGGTSSTSWLQPMDQRAYSRPAVDYSSMPRSQVDRKSLIGVQLVDESKTGAAHDRPVR